VSATSPEYQRFLDSVHAPLDSREPVERFDLEALAALHGHERDQAEKILLDLLDREDDGRVPDALAAMGSSRAAAPLKRALARGGGELMRVRTAEALWRLAQDPDALDVLRTLAETAVYWGARNAAIGALGRTGAAVDDALFAALDDGDEVVRYNAMSSIWKQHGLEAIAAAAPRGRLNGLYARAISRLAAVRAPAIAELRAALAALAAGQSAQALGLVTQGKTDAAATRVLASYNGRDEAPWRDTLDVDALRALDAHDREWAEHMLAVWAGTGDARAVRALGALRAARGRAALEELARGDDELAREAAQALRALDAS
jgi:HEAT repeats